MEVVEWGRRIAGKVEIIPKDELDKAEFTPSLPGKRVIHTLFYKVEGHLLPWIKPDPEDLAKKVQESLKKSCGLLGDNFVVHWYRYDEANSSFQIQVERIPPEIRPATAGIFSYLVVATIIAGIIFTYLSIKLIMEKGEKVIPAITPPIIQLVKEIGKFVLVGGAVGICGMIVYFVGKTKLKGG